MAFDPMAFTPETSYGPAIAAAFDNNLRGDEQHAIERLTKLADAGTALELGIGTGRLALPLVESGLTVDGIEMSEHMIGQLRAKPGGDSIRVEQGDMSVVDMGTTYDMVYVAYNSLMCLIEQDQQVDCFLNAARHLTPTGRFVVENVIPYAMYDLRRDRNGIDQYVNAHLVSSDRVAIDTGRYDRTTQRVDKCRVTFQPDGGHSMRPIVLRYIWHTEMDLMARIAGLRLQQRWGSWAGEPFTSRSLRHVSVYSR